MKRKFDVVADFSSDGDLLDEKYAERVGDQILNCLRKL